VTADLRVALLRAYLARLTPPPAPRTPLDATGLDATGRPELVYLRG
jgi:hypothetical protein